VITNLDKAPAPVHVFITTHKNEYLKPMGGENEKVY
jgi:hypothetical protein